MILKVTSNFSFIQFNETIYTAMLNYGSFAPQKLKLSSLTALSEKDCQKYTTVVQRNSRFTGNRLLHDTKYGAIIIIDVC